MLEDELGRIVGQPGQAGCAAVLAFLLEERGDPALLRTALGSYHFSSLKLAEEVCWVAAELQGSSAEPIVPDIRDKPSTYANVVKTINVNLRKISLGAEEYECLVAAVIEKVPAAFGAFIAEQRRRQIPDFVRTAQLQQEHAFVNELFELMLELAGLHFLLLVAF